MAYLTFEKPVPRWVFGLAGPGVVYVKSKVLPMGFSLATALLQHWHRRAALGLLPPRLLASWLAWTQAVKCAKDGCFP